MKLDDVLEILGVADAELILETAESLVEHDPKGALLAVERLAASGPRRDPVHARPRRPPAPPVRGADARRGARHVRGHGRAHRPAPGARRRGSRRARCCARSTCWPPAWPRVKDGSDPRIQLELALLKAVQPQSDLSIQALLFRIEQLERKLAAQARAGGRAGSRRPAPRAAAAAAAAAPSTRRGRERKRPLAAGSSARRPPASRQRLPRRRSAPLATAAAPQHRAAPARRPLRAAAAARARAGTRARTAVADLDLAACARCGRPSSTRSARTTRWSARSSRRPARRTLDGDRLVVCFAPDAGFSKKKVESNRQLVQGAVRTLTGGGLNIAYELSEPPAADARGPVAAAAGLSEEELLERLKEEFGAKEVFDDARRPRQCPSSRT